MVKELTHEGELLHKIVNLAARREFADKALILECIAILLASEGYTTEVDVF